MVPFTRWWGNKSTRRSITKKTSPTAGGEKGYPVKKETFKSYEDLPLMLSVPEMATALGISRAGAYELARSEGFPALRIGTRIVVPKDKLQEWVDKQIEKI